MSRGPLAVIWGAPPAVAARAGTLTHVPVELGNAGTAPWHTAVLLAYHWLDDRDNPIVWDGLRTELPPLAPGEHATVETRLRGPIPPGRYRLAFDVVAEHRGWFSEFGSAPLALEVQVEERLGEPSAELPPQVEPAPDWAERVRAAHAEGYAVVAGAIETPGGPFARRSRALSAYEPGPGRVPGFAAPLVCPSVLPGVELERLADVAGLPAFAAPHDEPWVYDGRVKLLLRDG